MKSYFIAWVFLFLFFIIELVKQHIYYLDKIRYAILTKDVGALSAAIDSTPMITGSLKDYIWIDETMRSMEEQKFNDGMELFKTHKRTHVLAKMWMSTSDRFVPDGDLDRCPICFDHKPNARLVVCGHVVCVFCILKMAKLIMDESDEDSDDDIECILCPLCKAPFAKVQPYVP
jgi:hypothetical protein